MAVDEDNVGAPAGSADFIAGVPTGMDHIFSQITQSLQDANVQAGVINNVIDQLQKNLVIIGEVVSIQTLSESGYSIVHVSAIKGKASLAFRFPSPNKTDGILSEFQRAQNYGFIVRVTYIFREKQNYIKSVEVIPRWTIGKK